MLDMCPDHTQNIALFDHLSDEVAECLRSRARIRQYRRGETICLQSEPSVTLKLLTHGCVKLFRVTPNGDEAIVATLEVGQSFDEIAALKGLASSASAEALDDCTIMHLDLNAICSCANAQTEIAQAVLAAAWGHMDQMMEDIEQLKAKSGVQRLCEYLIGLSDGQSGAQSLQLPFDKIVLAGKLGMQPESLSRAFKRLKGAGVESNRRQVQIACTTKLRDFSEDLIAA